MVNFSGLIKTFYVLIFKDSSSLHVGKLANLHVVNQFMCSLHAWYVYTKNRQKCMLNHTLNGLIYSCSLKFCSVNFMEACGSVNTAKI